MPGRDRPSLFYRLVVLTAKPVLYGLYRLEVDGLENVPATGGFVLSANHTRTSIRGRSESAIGDRHYLRLMAKSELYWRPLKWVVDAGGGFPVRRGERDTKAIETAVELAREGDVVVMFPEGTRRKKGLRKKCEARAHTGAARIALEAGVPLVPAAITGTDRLARLGKVRVRYGPPIELDDLRGPRPRTTLPSVATDRLMEAIHALEADAVTGPLLAIDGDSFAHRAYHGLPKSIRGAGGRPAGALVGFTNMLLRLWETERPARGRRRLGHARRRRRTGTRRSRATRRARVRRRAPRAARPAAGARRRSASPPRRRRATRRTTSWPPRPRRPTAPCSSPPPTATRSSSRASA